MSYTSINNIIKNKIIEETDGMEIYKSKKMKRMLMLCEQIYQIGITET